MGLSRRHGRLEKRRNHRLEFRIVLWSFTVHNDVRRSYGIVIENDSFRIVQILSWLSNNLLKQLDI